MSTIYYTGVWGTCKCSSGSDSETDYPMQNTRDDLTLSITHGQAIEARKIRYELFKNRRSMTVIPYHSTASIDNDTAFWTTNGLFRSLGRSVAGLKRTDFLDLLSVTHTESKLVYATPLHTAIKKDNLEELEHFLIRATVDKHSINLFGETAILVALTNEKYFVAETLLKHDCDCTTASSKGATPLHIATLDNRIDLMSELISNGADVNAVNNLGLTPLHLAVLASNYEAVTVLMAHDANPTQYTILELTPLMLALGFKDVDLRICQLLCEHDVHTATRLGNPVYYAVAFRHCLAKRLIHENTDVNYIVELYRRKTACVTEALTNVELFDLVWSKINQDILKEKLVAFLDLSILRTIHKMGKRHLMNVLFKIMNSPYALLIFKSFYKNLTVDTDLSFIELLISEFDLRNEVSDIISSLPTATSQDVICVFNTFKFDEQLEAVLKVYEYRPPQPFQYLSCNLHSSYICFNEVHRFRKYWLLTEVLHLLKFYTPNKVLRSDFNNRITRGVFYDQKVLKVCKERMARHSVPSLLELSRNEMRDTLFRSYKRPYDVVYKLPIPTVIRDILLLKRPIYC